MLHVGSSRAIYVKGDDIEKRIMFDSRLTFVIFITFLNGKSVPYITGHENADV